MGLFLFSNISFPQYIYKQTAIAAEKANISPYQVTSPLFLSKAIRKSAPKPNITPANSSLFSFLHYTKLINKITKGTDEQSKRECAMEVNSKLQAQVEKCKESPNPAIRMQYHPSFHTFREPS